MATIRLPASASELLPFCSRHSDPHKQTCFETYAHLLVTAASIGFTRGGNTRGVARNVAYDPARSRWHMWPRWAWPQKRR